MNPVARLAVAGLLLIATRPAAADDLLVFAAESLKDVLPELATAYEKTGRGHVTFTFGRSADLFRQIKAGPAPDAFFSADIGLVRELQRAELVNPGEQRTIISNPMVVVVPAGSTTVITRPADLKEVGKIALPNPDTVPAGTYAKIWLESLGLWAALEDKVLRTEDVRAVVAAVETGQANAGMVYAADAARSKGLQVAYQDPKGGGPRIVYTVAPLKRSAKRGTDPFIRFLLSKEAAPIYERHGFVVLLKQ